MFYSYRKFNKSPKKGIYILLIVIIILIIWGGLSYKGVNIPAKIITKDIVIPNK